MLHPAKIDLVSTVASYNVVNICCNKQCAKNINVHGFMILSFLHFGYFIIWTEHKYFKEKLSSNFKDLVADPLAATNACIERSLYIFFSMYPYP